MLDKLKERAKAIAAAVAPLVAIALVSHVERLAELSTEWKAVLIAAITSIATYFVPNAPEG
jgi:hypothetical protein